MSETEQSKELNYPFLLERIKAAFVDVLVMLALMTLFSHLFESMEEVSESQRMLAGFGIVFLIDPLFTSLIGDTIGHYAMGLRVKREDNIKKNINPLLALARFIVKTLLGWISLLTVNSNEKKKAPHDLLVGSVVIRK